MQSYTYLDADNIRLHLSFMVAREAVRIVEIRFSSY